MQLFSFFFKVSVIIWLTCLVPSFATQIYSANIKTLFLPVYDPTNPKHFIIKDNKDWNHINDLDKTCFFIRPGDYTALGDIQITVSGSMSEPRYIILYNGNDDHPAKLYNFRYSNSISKMADIELENRSNLAKYRLYLYKANYWIIDRQSFWKSKNKSKRMVYLQGSKHNVFNRALAVDTESVYRIDVAYSNINDLKKMIISDGNIIQNNHLEKTKWSVSHKLFSDLAAIGLLGQELGEEIINTHIINNEIINYVDGIQLTRIGKGFLNAKERNTTINFEGTIIANNNIYVTNIMYSDGNGKSDINGSYSFTENAIDLKAGSDNSNNPVIITQNYMWGYRQADHTYSDLGDIGSALVSHYDVRNVHILNNFIFNSNYGINIGGGLVPGVLYPLEDSIIENNIMYNMYDHYIVFESKHKTNIYDSCKNILIKNNIFATNNKKPVMKIYNADTLTVDRNTFFHTGSVYTASSLDNDKNKSRKSEKLSFRHNIFYSQENTFSTGIPKYAVDVNNTVKLKKSSYLKYKLIYHTNKFKKSSQKHLLEF